MSFVAEVGYDDCSHQCPLWASMTLFKAANAHFHLMALETVSSPGTFSYPVKPRVFHTWSRTERNPGNLLRVCKIGPFCVASTFGHWKHLYQPCFTSFAYFFAECSSLVSFPSGHLEFCCLYRWQFLLRSFSHSRTPAEQTDRNIHFIQ